MMNDKHTDRELLEMAALAAGIGIEWNTYHQKYATTQHCENAWWDPLADDGDEARLEAALGFSVGWGKYVVQVDEIIETFAAHNGDKQAARRRAGVRAAAAAIGAAK